MSLNFNLVVLAGRLTGTPEPKLTPSGKEVTSFTIAVNRRTSDGNERADFINCVAWDQRARFICQYFQKGSAICVQGALQTRSYDTQDGSKRYVTEVIVNDVRFVESKATDASAAPAAPTQASYASTPSAPPAAAPAPSQASFVTEANFVPVPTDDDLPF